jgi:hypothetical protein
LIPCFNNIMSLEDINMDFTSDEECTVDIEYETTPKINVIHSTKEFENTLVKDKGNIDKEEWSLSLAESCKLNDEEKVNTNKEKLGFAAKRSIYKSNHPVSMTVKLNFEDIIREKADCAVVKSMLRNNLISKLSTKPFSTNKSNPCLTLRESRMMESSKILSQIRR